MQLGACAKGQYGSVAGVHGVRVGLEQCDRSYRCANFAPASHLFINKNNCTGNDWEINRFFTVKYPKFWRSFSQEKIAQSSYFWNI